MLKNENSLKEEQDKKVNELIIGFEKEKENLKKRIAEMEKSLREAEGKKGSLLLELEKEKAKGNIEKDNLVTKYSELNDKMNRLEKRYESLLRENEKLRNEKNMLRRAGATTTGKYSLMLRDGGNTLGSSIIGNLGIGGKSIGLNQNYKSSLLRVMEKDNQENNEDGKKNNDDNKENLKIKNNFYGNNEEEEENDNEEDNKDDNE